MEDVDSKTVDSKTVDSKTVDSKTVDSKTVDSKTVDSKTVDSKTVDSKTVELLVKIQQTMEDIDSKTVEDKTVEDKTVEDKTVEDIHILYRKHLNRNPDRTGLAVYLEVISNGKSLEHVENCIRNSIEYRLRKISTPCTTQNPMLDLITVYHMHLKRDPTQIELINYIKTAANGTSAAEIELCICESNEARQKRNVDDVDWRISCYSHFAHIFDVRAECSRETANVISNSLVEHDCTVFKESESIQDAFERMYLSQEFSNHLCTLNGNRDGSKSTVVNNILEGCTLLSLASSEQALHIIAECESDCQTIVHSIVAGFKDSRKRWWTFVLKKMCSNAFSQIPIEPVLSSVSPVSVSVIIPSVGNIQLLSSCISFLNSCHTHLKYEVIVVSDGSRRTTRWCYTHVIPCVQLYKNKGFANACNLGAQRARGDYLLFLNDDCFVSDNLLDKVVMFLETNQDVGCCSPVLLWPDGIIQETGGMVFQNGRVDWNGCFGESLEPMPLPQFVSGACMAISTALFREVGGFDIVNRRGYFEDVDFCFKLRHRYGKLCKYVPDCLAWHAHSFIVNYPSSNKWERDQSRNREMFIRRWTDTEWEKQPSVESNTDLGEAAFGRK
jgi:GT2 family glycosyltransferase